MFLTLKYVCIYDFKNYHNIYSKNIKKKKFLKYALKNIILTILMQDENA